MRPNSQIRVTIGLAALFDESSTLISLIHSTPPHRSKRDAFPDYIPYADCHLARETSPQIPTTNNLLCVEHPSLLPGGLSARCLCRRNMHTHLL